MTENISHDGIADPYPGLVGYLEKTADERKQYNRSKYNKDVRKAARWAVKFLILFSQRQEEGEVRKVLDVPAAGELVEALAGHGCETIEPRHYEICKGVLWTARGRLRPLVDEIYDKCGVVANPSVDQGLLQLRIVQPPTESRPNENCEDERRATRQHLESKGYY